MTVGSTEGEENTLHLRGVSGLKTGTVNSDGRLYVGTAFAGEHVRYALINEGVIASLGSVEDSTLVMNDVVKLDRGKVLGNGGLYLGKAFSGEEVTVALTPIEDPEEVDENDESAENQQTAHS
jgi:hypothetical protein